MLESFPLSSTLDRRGGITRPGAAMLFTALIVLHQLENRSQDQCFGNYCLGFVPQRALAAFFAICFLRAGESFFVLNAFIASEPGCPFFFFAIDPIIIIHPEVCLSNAGRA
jgi:hypothetical protein